MDGLEHIRWLGGGTGGGKSTVARLLHDQFGVAVYSTDAAIARHSLRLKATEAPLFDAFRRMTMDERWVLREPAEMYRSFPWFQGEGFELLIEDLYLLPTDRITVAEGFRLLPGLVGPHLTDRAAAVWLLPTPDFRRAAFAQRRGDDAFWMRTSDPPRALDNLLGRDEIFAEDLARITTEGELRTIRTDGSQPPRVTVSTIAKTLDSDAPLLVASSVVSADSWFVARLSENAGWGEKSWPLVGELMAASGEKTWPRAAAGGLSGGADGPVAVELEQIVRRGN